MHSRVNTWETAEDRVTALSADLNQPMSQPSKKSQQTINQREQILGGAQVTEAAHLKESTTIGITLMIYMPGTLPTAEGRCFQTYPAAGKTGAQGDVASEWLISSLDPGQAQTKCGHLAMTPSFWRDMRLQHLLP